MRTIEVVMKPASVDISISGYLVTAHVVPGDKPNVFTLTLLDRATNITTAVQSNATDLTEATRQAGWALLGRADDDGLTDLEGIFSSPLVISWTPDRTPEVDPDEMNRVMEEMRQALIRADEHRAAGDESEGTD